MPRPRTLQAFSPEEVRSLHELLALVVIRMMGRKMEEADWSDVYCKVKGLATTSWSNLNIDVMAGELGVEHKMLCWKSNKDIREACGTSPMHPALTRSIRPPAADTDANVAMRDVLTQYGRLVQQRRAKVAEVGKVSVSDVDLRTGWLLWQESLRQFLYFEEEMLIPDPEEYKAEWVRRSTGNGARKPSTNLWIYEKSSGKKRYSVTTEAGAKIQPYFDVPALDDPNLYVITVIGEAVGRGMVRVWLAENTAGEIRMLFGSLEDVDTISEAILEAVKHAPELVADIVTDDEHPVSILIREDAYKAMCEAFRGKNDDHQFQLLASMAKALDRGC